MHCKLCVTQSGCDSLPSSFWSLRLIVWFSASDSLHQQVKPNEERLDVSKTNYKGFLHPNIFIHWGFVFKYRTITCTVFLHQVYLCSLAPFTFSFWSRDFIFIVAHKINYEAWGYLSISSAYFLASEQHLEPLKTPICLYSFTLCRKRAHEHPQTNQASPFRTTLRRCSS